jgi:hypothetical protein
MGYDIYQAQIDYFRAITQGKIRKGKREKDAGYHRGEQNPCPELTPPKLGPLYYAAGNWY